jgi:hypothetical protein
MSSIRQPPWATRTMRPRGIGVVGICQACRCSKEKFDRPTRMVAARAHTTWRKDGGLRSGGPRDVKNLVAPDPGS